MIIKIFILLNLLFSPFIYSSDFKLAATSTPPEHKKTGLHNKNLLKKLERSEEVQTKTNEYYLTTTGGLTSGITGLILGGYLSSGFYQRTDSCSRWDLDCMDNVTYFSFAASGYTLGVSVGTYVGGIISSSVFETNKSGYYLAALGGSLLGSAISGGLATAAYYSNAPDWLTIGLALSCQPIFSYIFYNMSQTSIVNEQKDNTNVLNFLILPSPHGITVSVTH